MTISHVAGATAPREAVYDVDVVILSLDRTDETLEAIASAQAQTGVSRHVTVCDQGSRLENLARLARAIEGRTDTTLLRSDVNLGVAGGRNAATGFGHGRVIVALDNDAEFAAPTTVADAAAALMEDPSLAAIGFRILLFDGGTDDLSSWGYPANLMTRSAASFDATTFVGAGHAIRRAAWQAADGYDESLFFCWEEYDFCLRAINLGWQVRYRGDIAVRHKVSGERRVAWSGNRWFHYVRNRLYIERKWDAGWNSLAPRVLGYVVKGLRHQLGWQTVRAVAAAEMMARRQASQKLSAPAAAYLLRNDRAHRGSLVQRASQEVLARLPGTSRGSPAKLKKSVLF